MSDKTEQKKEKLPPIPLDVMLAQGNFFEAQGKQYEIRPIKLKYVKELLEDQISVVGQIFNLADEKARAKQEKWIPRILFNKDGEPATLQQLLDDDWDVEDLKRFWRMAHQLSG